MLQKFDPASCADVWAELGDMPELAILSKDAVFGDELVILHHLKSCGNAIYGGRRRQYAIAGLEDSPLVVAINTKKMKSSNSATKVPTNTSLLACKTEEDVENLARPSGSTRSTERVETVIPNIMVIPPFIFKVISELEKLTFKKAFVLVRNELAKLDRIEARKTSDEDEEGEEEKVDEISPVVSVKYILVLQWLWAASKEDEIVAPFPTSTATDPQTIAWAQRVAEECLVLTAGREGARDPPQSTGGALDPEVSQTLKEINANLQSQSESKEREELGKKPAWKKFTDVSKRTILRLSAEFASADSVPDEPSAAFLEFTAAGSTANAQMLFAHWLKTKKCVAFPTKGMITALYGGILLPLDDAQGLGFNIFGLPSMSPSEPASEQDMIRQQINVTDGQGVSKEGAERMSVTILSPIYLFSDLRHRLKSLYWCYNLITGEKAYFTKRIGECILKAESLELQIIRGQHKKTSYMTDLSFMVTKKIILYTESCRDAEDGQAFATRHLEFDDIWNKVELGENVEITLPPCLYVKLRDQKTRALPQDAGYSGAPEDGRGGYQKRGRDNFNRNPEDRGEVSHNHKVKRQLMLDKNEYAPLIHNFVRHRDNKRWVPTRGGVPRCRL